MENGVYILTDVDMKQVFIPWQYVSYRIRHKEIHIPEDWDQEKRDNLWKTMKRKRIPVSVAKLLAG